MIFLFFTPSSLFISGLNTYSYGSIAQAGPVYRLFALATALTVGYCIITLFVAVRRARDNEQKNRIKYILGGIGLSIALLILNILPVLGFNIYPPGNFSFIPAIFLALGVLKYDLIDEVEAGYLDYGEMYGGEALFIPKPNASGEDDGYLVDLLMDDHSAELIVIDARTMTELARLHLPQRVPFGVHACWLTPQEIEGLTS